MSSGRRRWRWALWAAVSLFALLALLRIARPKPPAAVDTVKVARGQVREMIPSAAAGEVEPARRVVVRAELAGTVAEVRARRGDRVAESAVVVVFRADELEARLSQAAANAEAAAVTVRMARARLESAERALARAKKLEKGGLISSAEEEKAETEAVALRHGVEQAIAAEKQAQAALRLAKVARDRAVVRAPFAGVIQDVAIEAGVQAAPGQALFDLIDDSSVHLTIPVDEADIARISRGQQVLITTDARRDETMRGEVSFIPPAVGRSAFEAGVLQAGRRERSVYVEVRPEDPSQLRVGASVNAEFLVRAKDGVLFVPSRVVIGRGVKREVYVVRDGRARKLAFEPGLTSWDRTEVVSGLAEGDQVVATLDGAKLEDGARVVAR